IKAVGPYNGAKLLKLICRHLPDRFVPKTLAIARKILPAADFASVLSAFLEHSKKVPDGLLERVLDRNTQDYDNSTYSQIVAALAQYLPPERQQAAVAAALPKRPESEKLRLLYSHPRTAWRIAILIPYLSDGERAGAIEEAIRLLTARTSGAFPGWHDD